MARTRNTSLIIAGAIVLFAFGGPDRGGSGNGSPIGEESQTGEPDAAAETRDRRSYIVQGLSIEEASRIVIEVGGVVTDELGIINAVGALLTDAEVRAIERHGKAGLPFRVTPDGTVTLSGSVPRNASPTLVGATDLHYAGWDGKGITVAVLDTGIWRKPGTELTPDGEPRLLAQHDVLGGALFESWARRSSRSSGVSRSSDVSRSRSRDDDDDDDDDDDESSRVRGILDSQRDAVAYDQDVDDWNGHGTHVASVILGSDRSDDGRFVGVAPAANVVAVRAFDAQGSGRYIDVIKGIGWIVAHRDRFDIRVLNLSFSGQPFSRYSEDPLNQAVMVAWKAGIVVVAAAGNGGPEAMTIGVPGNVPYVITVGAMTDNYTPFDQSDDSLASFSSAGPTHEGFVKPEIVAPGGHVWGLMPPYSWIASEYPQYRHHSNPEYFNMSGTSQSAATVSGVVALMLQRDPWLEPDDVKCRLLATARSALRADGSAAYSIFQQGAGLVHAYDAVFAADGGCANLGLDIENDILGRATYVGLARRNDSGAYYLLDPTSSDGRALEGDGFIWSRGSLWGRSSLWSRGALWGRSSLWSRGSLWGRSSLWSRGSLWSRSALWSRSSLWSRSALWSRGSLPGETFSPSGASGDTLQRPMTINAWVEPE